MTAKTRARTASLLFVFVGLVKPALAADAALIDAAKKEGHVVWYTSLIIDQLVRPAAAAFERKYGITVEYIRADPGDIAIRVASEAKAGKPQSDFFDGFGMPQLVRAGYVASWLPDAAKNMPQRFFDPAGYWLSTCFYVLTPGFNTDLVKKGSEPRTFDDLLDPRWKGRMAWSSRQSASSSIGFIGSVMTEMGETKGLDYLRKLSAQNIVNIDGSARQILDQTIAGEHPIALQIFNHHAVISASQGAPVDWSRFEPSMGVSLVLQLTAHARNPNAAKLMLDFLSSREGQELFRAADYMPVDPGVPLRDEAMRPETGGFRARWFTPDELDDGQKHWAAIYKDLFK